MGVTHAVLDGFDGAQRCDFTLQLAVAKIEAKGAIRGIREAWCRGEVRSKIGPCSGKAGLIIHKIARRKCSTVRVRLRHKLDDPRVNEMLSHICTRLQLGRGLRSFWRIHSELSQCLILQPPTFCGTFKKQRLRVHTSMSALNTLGPKQCLPSPAIAATSSADCQNGRCSGSFSPDSSTRLPTRQEDSALLCRRLKVKEIPVEDALTSFKRSNAPEMCSSYLPAQQTLWRQTLCSCAAYTHFRLLT